MSVEPTCEILKIEEDISEEFSEAESDEIENENDEMQNNKNPLQRPEILSKILAYLPQIEMVRNRSVSRYWRDTIDQHCTVKVDMGHSHWYGRDKFFYRKLQLRIRECRIFGLQEEFNKINFASPQTIRAITFPDEINVQTVRHLLNQAKPYLHFLKLENDSLIKDIFTPPYGFPLLRELRIKQIGPVATSVNLDILFSHRMPLLKTMHIEIYQHEMHIMDEIHKGLFIYLAAHHQTLKRLVVRIGFTTRNEDKKLSQLPVITQILHKLVKLQLEDLELIVQPKYISVWAAIIRSQKNLIRLSVTDDDRFREVVCRGVPFNVILPGIDSSFATLRTIRLENLVSVSSSGSTWIPLDCTAFRNVVNLTELELCRKHEESFLDEDVTLKPNENEGAPIINLGEIPLACLKKFEIKYFVCDSGELQTLMDNAPMLEHLVLWDTLAPSNNPIFASTGVHGGIIQSFMEKLNKKSIQVFSINYSNQEENNKLDVIRLLYPHAHDHIQTFQYYFD